MKVFFPESLGQKRGRTLYTAKYSTYTHFELFFKKRKKD